MATISSNGALVSIQGLTEFSRALSAVSKDFPKQLKEANYNLAKTLRDRARIRSQRTGLATTAKAARSLRASRGSNYAAVTGGGSRYPFFYGAEFGSKRYKQFLSWRGNQWEGWNGGPGYFLNPTIRMDGRALLEKYYKEVDALTARAFPE